MCGVCGCGHTEVSVTDMETGKNLVLRAGGGHEHGHAHGAHDHGHAHSHAHGAHDHGHAHRDVAEDGEMVRLEAAVLGRNDRIAGENRAWFSGRGVLAINLVSAPGSGKTSLLERTILELKDELSLLVIEGDQMTLNDARRIREAGARAVQVNTGAGCHLEADMVGEAVRQLDPDSGSLLMIENVGNLVCPALFDLGERMKVVVISVTEGEDKPLKYPHMFRSASWVVLNKMDLAPHTDFDEELCRSNIEQVNPTARIFRLSARTGEGMESWLSALREEHRAFS